MRGHAFIAEMNPAAFGDYAAGFAAENMQPLDAAAQARVRAGKHPDFVQIYPDGNAVKIGQVRDLIADASQKPYEGGRRLIAIHSADSMTQQAQNALLKSLEEPNDSTAYLLLCESAERLLPTVRSRCALLRTDAANRAATPTDEDELAVRELAVGLMGKLLNGGSPSQLAKDMPEERPAMKQAISALLCYFLDAMRMAAGYDRIINKDFPATGIYWKGRSPRLAAECVELCNRAKSMLDSNVSAKLCASWLFIEIWEVMQ